MGMHLDSITIQARPFRLLGTVELHLEIEVNGERMSKVTTIAEHDLIPFFDLYCSELMKEMRTALLSVQAQRPGQE